MIIFPIELFKSSDEGARLPDGCEWTVPINEKSMGNMCIGKVENPLPYVAAGGITNSEIIIEFFVAFPLRRNIVSFG